MPLTLPLLCVICTGLVVSAIQTTRHPKLPNILLMMVDDVGIGDVGCFGNTTLPTPNIDSIANEGVKLTQHLATSGVCTPSRASFLTGRYAVKMGMVSLPTSLTRVEMFVGATGGLPAEEITFAEVLKQKNYSTALIGKWHLGLHGSNKKDFLKSPINQGFDYFYGMPLTNLKDFGNADETVVLSVNPYLEQLCIWTLIATIYFIIYGYQKRLMSLWLSGSLALPIIVFCLMFWFSWMNLPMMSGIVFRNQQVVEQPVRLDTITQRLVKEGKQFLEQRAQDDRPFLLFMSWIQAHTALHAHTTEFKGKSAHGAYGDEIMMMDWSVGQILDALELYGFKDNTIVYFTSDHGGHTEERDSKGRVEGGFNGVYRGGKGMGGWDGGIRVPTVMRWPGVIPPRTEVDVATSHMDILPTLAAAAGAEIQKDRPIDGVNILPLLTGEKKDDIPHEFLWHYCGYAMHAARWTPTDNSGNIWKVHFITPTWIPGTEECFYQCRCYGNHVTEHSKPLLFNLATDPAERRQCTEQDPCGNENYTEIVSIVRKESDNFENSLQDVESQFAWYNYSPRPWLQPCCNFPFCHCEEN